MTTPTSEDLRSIAKFYYAVSQELSNLAIHQVPAKEVMRHIFNIAWISGIAAYQDGIASLEEINQIERDAYAHASRSAEEESDE